MKNFDQSGLWNILRDPEATVGVEQADDVLGKFATELHRYCREEKDLAERHRTLTLARSFIIAPQGFRYAAAPNGVSDYISSTAMGIIDGELDILKMELEHPKRFVNQNKSPAPLALWTGTGTELLEVFTSIHLTGKLLKPTYEPMPFSDVITLIRDVFGASIARPYDRKTKMFTRTKGGAPFLERLTAIYLRKVEDVFK